MRLIRKSYSLLKHSIIGKLYKAPGFHSAKKKLAFSDALSREEKVLLGKVSARVHPSDGMYYGKNESAEDYISAGLSAVWCIEHALKVSNRDHEIPTILDFPCGYGRVLRFLKVRFPAANITASEIDPIALEFCRRVFSVKTLMSNIDFSRLSMADKFDLIWCGSLITHIDDKATAHLLRFFHDHLTLRGLCIFTTHGDRAAEKIQTYGLTEGAQQQVLSQFHENGYGYADYPGCCGTGISIVSHERMLAIARSVGQWNETFYLAHGWHNLQDVYAFAF